MTNGHHHYIGTVSISYDARGEYLLKCPTGHIFPSFETVLTEFYHFSFYEGAYRPWPFGGGMMIHGEYHFDLTRNAVTVRTKNLHPRMQVETDRYSPRARFYGEVVFRDDCGRKISAFHVLQNFSRIHQKALEEKTRHGGCQAGLHFTDFTTLDYRTRPVPGTGCRKRYKWDSTRPPVSKEISENAALAYDEDCIEHGIRHRASRRARMLEEHLLWDCSMRNDWRDRTWKRHRRYQWK